MFEKIRICKLFLHICDYNEMLKLVELAILNRQHILITYLNFNTLNIKIRSDLFSAFQIVHPDGVAVFMFVKYIFKKKISYMTGSDFYPLLIKESIKNNWKIFIFGDTKVTLQKIDFDKNNVIGINAGYRYNDNRVVAKINSYDPEIVLVGLGQPKQEIWINKNYHKLKASVIIAVGDGIKVFSNTKRRGPKIVRKLYLEWLVRIFFNPQKYFKRYFCGIPKILFCIISRELKK